MAHWGKFEHLFSEIMAHLTRKYRFFHKACFVASYNVIFTNIVTTHHVLVPESKNYP